MATRHQPNLDPLLITNAEVSNGAFLTKLDEGQPVAVIAIVFAKVSVAECCDADITVAAANILMEHYPIFAFIVVKKATTSCQPLRTEIREEYLTTRDVPEDQRPCLAYLQLVQSGHV